MHQNKVILKVSNLSKSFGGIKALDNIEFNLQKGEVHALMGENGAGKSTFMKILMGLLQPDSGEIFFEDKPLVSKTVNDNLAKGISMIHQEMLAVPELTVAQNIFLGQENSNNFWLNDYEINQKATVVLQKLGLNIKPTTKLKKLSIAEQQMVEIAKAISMNAKIIIMDEPTSALSDTEVDRLFLVIKELKANGVAIIYISHKMDEIYKITDRITVLRDGQYIITKPTSELDQNALIATMVGRELTTIFENSSSAAANNSVLLSVKNLGHKNHFSNISFEVSAGEVFGIAGLMGAGRTEIARAIYGLDKPDSGEIWVKGENINIDSPQKAIKYGIGYVSEDRKAEGFIPDLSVKNNLSLSSLNHFSENWFVNSTLETTATTKLAEDLKVKASQNQLVKNLSGGNQQKVVIGKTLLANPEIIILDEPTRGIDIGAKFEIYKLINDLKAKGLAIILISSELPEIIGLSDRVMVISKGKQTAILLKNEVSQENIMRYAVN